MDRDPQEPTPLLSGKTQWCLYSSELFLSSPNIPLESKSMKTNIISCLSLIMMIGSLATAQQLGPSLSPPCGSGPTRSSVIDWPQFRFAPCHTGYNPYEFVLSPATVGSLAPKWQYATGDRNIESSPTVVKGVVYFGTDENRGGPNVFALNAKTGALLWQYTAGNVVQSSPTVANDVAYFGSGDNNFYALNARTGALLWQHPLVVSTGSSPAVANGVVYVGADALYALDAKLGTLLWKFSPVFAGRGQWRGLRRVL